MHKEPQPEERRERPLGARIRFWVGRFGVIGFLFFLVKGLLWLLIPSLIAIGLL
ncbi:MAG: hypothetical protein GF346_11455 [Candidatus Eisenbacteria bacterium]|nr:hypothetical protein [Candidatus Latescibacterota bacterium]MBD3303052.1 hypothetical protein [Candidatus Eisenbacteria bacterium]